MWSIYLINRVLSYNFVFAILAMLPFLIVIAFINPFNNVFYGGDDWMYGWSVQTLMNTGELHISDWASAPAIPQILWATLFVKIFGWSIAILNISTVVIAFFGGFAFFQLLSELGVGRRIAVFSTIIMTTTPLYLGMAGSFMSDMMYTSLMLIACNFYLRSICLTHRSMAFIGSMFCSAAFISRQVGVVLLIAYILAMFYFFLNSKTSKQKQLSFQLGVFGGIVPIFVIVLYIFYPEFFGGRSIAQQITLNPSLLFSNLLNIPRMLILSLVTFNHIVVLLLPLLISLLFEKRKLFYRILMKKQILFVCIVLILVIATIVWYLRTGRIAITGDVLLISARYTNDSTGVLKLWWVLTFIGIGPGSLLLVFIWNNIQSWFTGIHIHKFFESLKGKRHIAHWRITRKLFIVLLLIGHLILTTSYTGIYNNYFLPLIPLFIICVLLLFPDIKFPNKILIAPAAVYVIVSLFYIEGHARFVEASWKKGDKLAQVENEVPNFFLFPSWHGWNQYEFLMNDLRNAFVSSDGSPPEKRLSETLGIFGKQFKKAKIYVVGSERHELFGKIPLVETLIYHTLLGDRNMYILKKSDDKK